MKKEDLIVLDNLPIVKAATMPNNEKQHDWLLNRTFMTKEDCELLDKILANYQEKEVAT